MRNQYKVLAERYEQVLETDQEPVMTVVDNDELGYRKEWRLNGVLHRVDGPAIERPFKNTKEWYQNGELHRVDGPAMEYIDDDCGFTKVWFQNDKLHRVGGPSVERSKGFDEWHQNGRHHRLDGPAVDFKDGTGIYYIHGKKYRDKKEYNIMKGLLALSHIRSKQQ